MKKLITISIICAAIVCSCKQNSSNTVKKDSNKTIKTIEQYVPEEKKEVVTPSTKEKIRKPVLDTINTTGSDGVSLKILVYEYLYPDNQKYLRDFDITNTNDSIILSAMQKEYHWEGDVSADDIGQINIVPSYYLKNDSLLDLAFGFYINPYDIAEKLDRYDVGSVREYLSYSFDEYMFEDSVMTFMNFTLTSKNINPIKFLVKLNNEDAVTNDSIFNILKNNKQNTSWGLTAVINGSIKNMINGSMTYDELRTIPLLFKYPIENDDRSILQYLLQSYIYHYNRKDYELIYNN